MLWYDGGLRDDGPVPFDLRDRGLLLGDGLFETLPVFGGHAFRADDHLARMEAGAAVLGMPFDGEAARAAILALAGAARGHATLRLTLTRGAGQRGLRLPEAPTPLLFGTLAPWSPALVMQPTRLATVAIRRNQSSPASRVKALPYLDNVLALEAAIAAGADDALMLNGHGHIACASAANLFLKIDGRLITPPVTEGALGGIMRNLILAEGGLDAAEGPLAPTAPAQAEGAVLTNSVRLVSPVTRADGHPLAGSGEIGYAVLASLRRLIRDECRCDPFED